MIYLDNNATTQPLPEVVEAMHTCLREAYANPSSVHQFGQGVRHKVECAREQVARLVGASPKEIIFTSGGTESINLAIRGGLRIHPHRRHFVTTAVEHSAVLRVAEQSAAEGYTVDYVGVDQEGRLDEAEWAEKITDRTALVSLLHANNETGVMFDVARLAAVAADKGVPVHVDAVQSAGKVPLDVTSWPVQLVSIAGHKFHGPKGIGALYVRRRTRIEPLILGGSQERLLRGGTENVEGIVGMGVAAEIAVRDGARVAGHVRGLRDALEAGVIARAPFAHVSGRGTERIYNTSNIAFEGLEAEAILILLSEAGVCASSGAACSSGSLEPSHVLKAMGIDDRIAHGAIRFSLSRFNTREEIDQVVSILPGLLSRLTVLSAR
ncbi:MAG: aminotransferase class V-fold PLP-dependent enzyme [Planctomycetota bacterium]